MKTCLILLALVGLAVSVPTCSQIKEMRAAVIKAVQNETGLLPKMVRLGFHDCVGGCNGCINFNNPDNNGLQNAVATLNSLYTANNYQSFGVSRADFWVFAASLCFAIGVRSSNIARNGGLPCNAQSCPGPCPVPCIEMQWGRVDADTCLDEPELPSPTMTSTEMFAYFQEELGFSKTQVVSLMGVHSLGGAVTANSGYKGKWTGNSNFGLSEALYTNMVSSGIEWTNVNVADKSGTAAKWQFNGKNLTDGKSAGFMLNTDFEIFYDISLDSDAKATCTLKPTCGLTKPDTCSGSCPVASTFDQALAYSKNCTLFMTDFVPVFTSMLTHNNDNLVPSSPDCCPI